VIDSFSKERALRITTLLLSSILTLVAAGPALAQQPCPCPPPPAPPPPVWTGSASLGLGLTSGNSETRNFNVAFDVMRDPKTRHVFKAGLLYLWSSDDGDDTANRLAFQAREEYKLSDRAYVYGQGQYLRDPFKAIDYLFASTGGLGYKLADSDTTKFSVDGGAGVTWEKNPGIDTRTYAAITAGEDFSHKLSPTASITEGFHALWKADDFGDALYTFGAGLAATVTTKTAVKVDLLDTVKTKPPAGTKENDLALIVALAYKF
jgi:putative salt-induced outer membrane protein